VMMFDPGPYDKLEWNDIVKMLGIDRINQLFSEKQLISFLNWSEIGNSSDIWNGILNDILPLATLPVEKPYFFTDFSDCSRRTNQEIRLAIDLLGRFRNYFKVIVSLNQNEAEIIARALDLPENETDENFMQMMFNVCNSDIIIVHRTKDALAFDGIAFEKCDTFFCDKPMILTGGGDNFNAGFCFSQFLDLNLLQSLIVANAVSGYYIRTGISPDIERLIKFLNQNNSGSVC